MLLCSACEDTGLGLSSPICGLEVDVALSMDQKRFCNTIYSSSGSYFLSIGFVVCHFLICVAKIQCVSHFYEGPEELAQLGTDFSLVSKPSCLAISSLTDPKG